MTSDPGEIKQKTSGSRETLRPVLNHCRQRPALGGTSFMKISRWPVLVLVSVVAACVSMRGATHGAAAGVDVRTPLGAELTPDAKTGAQVPLHVDTDAKVI